MPGVFKTSSQAISSLAAKKLLCFRFADGETEPREGKVMDQGFMANENS